MNILIVEDSPSDRGLLHYMLESRFPKEVSQFHEVGTLSKALEVLEEKDIDCIILDLQLPDSTGKQTFLRLYERHFHVPIIVMTHNKDRQLAIDMVQAGASDFIIKNFTNEEELFHRIVLTIERHQAQKPQGDDLQAILKKMDNHVLITGALKTQLDQLQKKLSVSPLALDEANEKVGLGQKAAENVAQVVGSWKFILIQSTVIILWITLNVVGGIAHWDAYPFILMNLVLSLQAAYTAPMIMMAQNRLSQKDRIIARTDYEISHQDYVMSQEIHKTVQDMQAQMVLQNERIDTVLKKLATIPSGRGEFPSRSDL